MWTKRYLLVLILSWSIAVNHCSQNLARPGTAVSNNVLRGRSEWTASRAIDGNRNQDIWCDSCLHTDQYATIAYLRIDLRDLSSINRVEIFYRIPYFGRCELNPINSNDTEQNYRLKGYEIHISYTAAVPSDNKLPCYKDESIPFPTLYQNNPCVGTGRYVYVVQRNKSEKENLQGPVLELCEVEVYGCRVGSYGPDCSQTCPNCLGSECDPDTGVCRNGCNDGYTGDMCDQVCSKGFYGRECLVPCGVNCLDNDCNNVNGICLRGCKSGYQGLYCYQKCRSGTFGVNCSQTCGKCRNGATCNHVNGSCPNNDCADGYTGELCMAECGSNTYGYRCSETCGRCDNGDSCDNVAGDCPSGCVPGWIGLKCKEKCRAGWYGMDCTQQCIGNCYQNATCNNEDGRCDNGCEKGYKGLKCDEECDEGTYGMGCKEKCGQCNARECDSREGTCQSGCIAGWLPPYCAQRIVAPEPPGTPTAGIIGGLVAALVLLVLVLLIIIIIKRRRRGPTDKVEKGESATVSFDKGSNETGLAYVDTSTGKDIQSANKGINIPKNDIIGDEDEEIGENAEQMYTNTASVKLGKTEMKVSDLRSRITAKINDGEFSNEYSHLVRGAVQPHDIGKDPKNKAKNRFLTTFPYDHSLVKISSNEYINANYIDGMEIRKQYIATQGPKPNTLEDFWRMVWEHNTGKIIMLANIVELGKKKCEQYWPAKKGKSMTVGPYQIALKEERTYGAYTIRDLKLKEKEGIVVRTLYQFHYTTWPDHGTPDVMQFVDFLHATEAKETSNTGPMIVHCSAGIGRTGTYIALDELSKWIKNNSKVDVFEFVQSMRKNRMNMIQNLEQYIVVHQALVEEQMLAGTTIPRAEFPNVWDKQLKHDLPKNEQRSRIEYTKLQSVRPTVDELSKQDALSDENKMKNRQAGIIPLKKYRPYLSSFSASRTNYINAVMLPCKAAQTGFVVTQYPMTHTVEDFWCLVYDQESSYVVILEPVKEKTSLFPSESGTVLYGNIHVKQTSVESGKDSTERIIEVQKKDTDDKKIVHVVENSSWLSQKSVPTSPTSILYLLQKVFDWSHGQSAAFPIIVVCLDGSTKCGLFCSLYNILENLNETGEIDVFRSVRELQIRRPEFINDVKQYEFLYEAVHEYLEQSSIYANT